MKRFHLAIAFLVLAVFCGCTGLGTLKKASEPTDLYALTPKSTFSSTLPRISQQIVVNEPTATAAVNTDQIAVHPTPLRVQYLPQARWVDRAPLIVQALLIESFENTGKVAAVGRSSVALRADYAIVSDVREFQAFIPENAGSDESLQVVVGLNVKIVSEDEDNIIASKSFERTQQSLSDKPDDLVAAFDIALGSVMRNAVEWSIRRIHSHSQSIPKDQNRFLD